MLRRKTKDPGIITAIEVLREMSLSKALKAEWDYYWKQKRDRTLEMHLCVKKESILVKRKALILGKILVKRQQ